MPFLVLFLFALLRLAGLLALAFLLVLLPLAALLALVLLAFCHSLVPRPIRAPLKGRL